MNLCGLYVYDFELGLGPDDEVDYERLPECETILLSPAVDGLRFERYHRSSDNYSTWHEFEGGRARLVRPRGLELRTLARYRWGWGGGCGYDTTHYRRWLWGEGDEAPTETHRLVRARGGVALRARGEAARRGRGVVEGDAIVYARACDENLWVYGGESGLWDVIEDCRRTASEWDAVVRRHVVHRLARDASTPHEIAAEVGWSEAEVVALRTPGGLRASAPRRAPSWGGRPGPGGHGVARLTSRPRACSRLTRAMRRSTRALIDS